MVLPPSRPAASQAPPEPGFFIFESPHIGKERSKSGKARPSFFGSEWGDSFQYGVAAVETGGKPDSTGSWLFLLRISPQKKDAGMAKCHSCIFG